MTLGDLIARVRNATGDFRPANWNDMRIIQLINDAQAALSLRLDFPRQSIPIPTIANQREYQLPELVKLWCVYIQSPDGSIQEAFGTDISTIQGDNLQGYDNTSGTQMGAPIQSPQWLTGQPVPYPYQTAQVGGWVPTKLPWQNTTAQRNAFYLRGGYIGILPVPATSTSTILVDCVPAPPLLVQTFDQSLFPLSFANALKWKVIADMRDSDSPGSQSVTLALQRYESELAQNVSTVERLQATNPKIWVPLTVRGLHRFNQIGWGLDGVP
jgi:hypothetical protein